MIFITAKFPIKPECADEWPTISKTFTDSVNAEDGCLFFEWSRSLTEPTTYILLEGFRDDDAGKVHVESEHFKVATDSLPEYLSATPEIINMTVDGWSELGEMAVS